MTLGERVVALHRALAAAGLPHAFGGAIALAFATENPRGTSDIDINIFVPAEDAEDALSALPHGVEVPPDAGAIIARDGQTRLWWEATPVDLFFDYAAVHTDAARHRRTVPFEGTEIPVLAAVELAVFKIMFDRLQDWADVEAMLRAGMLDIGAVRSVLAPMLDSDDQRFARLDDVVRRAQDR